ncbi:MAG: PAS domain-containing protein [Alphaproteobacteria bacterium]|nr:PAS domain-containing protein [Alphaproteobacteria bacterium]
MGTPDYPSLHPRYARVRDYLQKVAPPGRLPGRSHVDPGALRDLLPLINLVDVIRDKDRLRFRFRLVGTEQTEKAAREITGKFVEDAVVPEFVDRILANMRTVVAEKAPVYDRFPMPHPEREFIDSERIYFPLATDGEMVDMILIVNGYPDGVGDPATLAAARRGPRGAPRRAG